MPSWCWFGMPDVFNVGFTLCDVDEESDVLAFSGPMPQQDRVGRG
jgi:hypothetical protein